MSSGRVRLFVAASVPGDQLDWVAAQTAPLRQRWPQARWAPRENQHVTLKFIGSVAADALDDAIRACRQVAATAERSEIGLTGLGAFPTARRARVLWIGLDDPAGVLVHLAAGLDAALRPLGVAPEKRPFSAHLTLARFRTPHPLAPLPALEEPPAAFTLDRFELWRSHLSPKGARYELMEAFPLPVGHAS